MPKGAHDGNRGRGGAATRGLARAVGSGALRALDPALARFLRQLYVDRGREPTRKLVGTSPETLDAMLSPGGLLAPKTLDRLEARLRAIREAA